MPFNLRHGHDVVARRDRYQRVAIDITPFIRLSL